MARLLGHRQTKGAANRQTEPTATAPHLYSTDLSRAPAGSIVPLTGHWLAPAGDLELSPSRSYSGRLT